MPKTRQQKEQTVDELSKSLQNAKSATLTSFSSIPVSVDRQLRQSLRQEQVEYSVIKKTLLKKVLQKLGYSTDNIEKLVGNISIAISSQDEVAPAKIINKFAQDNENIKITGGILDGQWIEQARVEELAKLLSKPELIAKTIGTIKAPLSGFVNLLVGNMRGLINVLNSIKENKA
jgi:large subunit ribosomal protein L10